MHWIDATADIFVAVGIIAVAAAVFVVVPALLAGRRDDSEER